MLRLGALRALENRAYADRQRSGLEHLRPHPEMAAVMAGQGAEDVNVGVQPWLGPRDHGAADTWLGGQQRDVPDSEWLPGPVILVLLRRLCLSPPVLS